MKDWLAQWMESNPIGFALGAMTAGLLTLGVLLSFFWRSGAALTKAPEEAMAAPLPELPAKTEGLGPLGAYEEVNSRPLFNVGRRPIVIAQAPADEAPTPQPAKPQAPPPDLRLTGVVITPEQRLVTLTPEKGGEALVVAQGKPLEGEYFGWRVGEVQARSVKLRAAGGRTISKELSVYDRPIAAPPKPKPKPKPQDRDPAAQDADESPEQSPSRADEIRERIRQRREQMRSEAAQEEQSRGSATEEKRNSYRDAIQALMASPKDEDTESDNEEASGDE